MKRKSVATDVNRFSEKNTENEIKIRVKHRRSKQIAINFVVTVRSSAGDFFA